LCEVCHEPITDISKLPAEIQEQVYRPGADEAYNVEISVEEPKGMGEEVIQPEVDEDGRIKVDLGRLLADDEE